MHAHACMCLGFVRVHASVRAHGRARGCGRECMVGLTPSRQGEDVPVHERSHASCMRTRAHPSAYARACVGACVCMSV